MSVALATHPVLHCIEEWHWWGYSLYLRHRSKWRWKTGLKKRERANKHIFSDLRNMTIAYIRMIAGAWHSASNWISQPLCPLVITCWAVTWKVLMCGKRARCSRVEVTGVKDPIPLLLSIFEFLFSRDSWGTTCPVVKPNTSLTFSCKSKVVKPWIVKQRGRRGRKGGISGGSLSTVGIRGHGLIACFIYFLMLMWAEYRRALDF